MDPLWAFAAEFWWIAPVAAAAGGAGVLAVRTMKREGGRRLAYDAARMELQLAQQDRARTRAEAKSARAHAARVAAERAASRADADDVAEARRAQRAAERNARAASAAVRARRAARDAARRELAAGPPPEQWPLPRLRTAHDALIARWMTYETDPHKAIAYPTMSDGRDPDTAAFLATADEARRFRPAEGARVTPAAFAVYRDAVDAMSRALDRAERAAVARSEGRDPAAERARANSWPGTWQDAAQDAADRSARLLDDAADAVSAAIATWTERNPFRRKGPR